MIERIIPLLAPIVIVLLLCFSILHSPLRSIPSTKLHALTKWRLAFSDYLGTRSLDVKRLHDKYGSVVRIGPNEVSFASLSALRSIYGPGSNFGRTDFYAMFDVYGRKNLFTFHTSQLHAERKKMLSHLYSKSSITSTSFSVIIERKVEEYLRLLKREPQKAGEIFTSLHYFSMDAITDFVYGSAGRTNAMDGNIKHRSLLDDILDPDRRRLSWFVVHLPRYTRWILSCSGTLETIIARLGLLPMKKPTTYTGIRRHALEAFQRANAAFSPASDEAIAEKNIYVISHLLHLRHVSQLPLSDLDIASECADHLLAGVDTTADTLMFVLWALSLPEHAHHQRRLRSEIHTLAATTSLPGSTTIPVKLALTLPFLDAVLKETLRLYAPLPATEPRSSPFDTVIDGYAIPANTVVGAAPFVLHRNTTAFPDPLAWDPTRWTGGPRDTGEAGRRWFWAFSSGARMCIGVHLAMAEMACLVASVYWKYETRLRDETDGRAGTPAITSRFELFYDEVRAAQEGVREHECWVDFVEGPT